MDEIVFPQYGRVAIVDDNFEEVRVIQNILAENGVPYIFYDYQTMQEVDIVQVEGIRLLFLDIRLEDGSSSEMNILTVLASAVEKVIPANNGPYYIILWTNEAQMKDKVIEFLNERLDDTVTTKPVMIETMDKKDFLSKNLDEISAEVIKVYREQNMLAFLTDVENNLMKVPSKVVKLIAYSFLQEFSNEELEKLLLRFAFNEAANCDNSLNATKTVMRQIVDLIRNRYMEIMADEKTLKNLSELWTFDFSNQEQIDAIKKERAVEQKAVVNTVLNTNIYEDKDDNVPGKIYMHSKDSIRIGEDLLFNSTFNDEIKVKSSGKEIPYELVPIELDITPSCDYAQGKNHLLRTLYGYLVYFDKIDDENDCWEQIDYNRKINDQSPDYVIVSPVFMVNKRLCVLAINTKLMDLKEHDYCDNLTYLFRLNDEITNEIRKKTGEVISRLGFNSLNY